MKNGKTLNYSDGYQVKDGYVLFHDKAGDLFKLPEKLVDLKKTKALADSVKQAAPDEEKIDDQNLSDFEKYVLRINSGEVEEGSMMYLERSVEGSRKSYRNYGDRTDPCHQLADRYNNARASYLNAREAYNKGNRDSITREKLERNRKIIQDLYKKLQRCIRSGKVEWQ
ncbi:MAG: hypothetical protein QNK37_30965 [Acidobacteriota bacterium]|nr:hypothetical protein [Acidobacteriota bacterium]